MIRTQTEVIKFPQAGWLKTLIVERIRRIRLKPTPQAKKLPTPAQMQELRERFKVVEKKR